MDKSKVTMLNLVEEKRALEGELKETKEKLEKALEIIKIYYKIREGYSILATMLRNYGWEPSKRFTYVWEKQEMETPAINALYHEADIIWKDIKPVEKKED